jgi:archaemetzincin
VTDVDLFIPVLTFVFGEAQLGQFAAVMSIARLRDAAMTSLVVDRLAGRPSTTATRSGSCTPSGRA